MLLLNDLSVYFIKTAFITVLGPRWYPIIGSALEVARLRKKTGFFSETCNYLEKIYGPIIGLKIGNDHIVVLNNFESMRSMIMNENCDGRPVGPVYDSRTFGKRQGEIAWKN